MKRLAALLASSFIAGDAVAQSYPSKPITLVVPLAIGSTSDILSRTVGAELAKLPRNRVPERSDWAKLSSGWTTRIQERIAGLGRTCVDWGDVEVSVAEATEVGDPRARYLDSIKRSCERVAALVALVGWSVRRVLTRSTSTRDADAKTHAA